MKVSRREFAITTALAALAPSALAENPPKPAAETPAPPTTSPEAEARIQWILGKYGSRFTDEQKADIRRLVTGSMGGFEAMRAYPLDNSVEPALVFHPRRYGKKRPSKVTVHERGEKS